GRGLSRTERGQAPGDPRLRHVQGARASRPSRAQSAQRDRGAGAGEAGARVQAQQGTQGPGPRDRGRNDQRLGRLTSRTTVSRERSPDGFGEEAEAQEDRDAQAQEASAEESS